MQRKESKPRGSDHRPTRQHIAYLGGILQDDVKHVERRAAFWAKATAKLDALSKRVSSSEEIRSYHRAQQRRQARRRGSRGATGPNSSASNRAGESVARARAAPPAPRAATPPPRRRARLRIFVVRCGLPCDPPVGGRSCNGRMIPRFQPLGVRGGRPQTMTKCFPVCPPESGL